MSIRHRRAFRARYLIFYFLFFFYTCLNARQLSKSMTTACKVSATKKLIDIVKKKQQ